jgi:hypothetical protein
LLASSRRQAEPCAHLLRRCLPDLLPPWLRNHPQPGAPHSRPRATWGVWTETSTPDTFQERHTEQTVNQQRDQKKDSKSQEKKKKNNNNNIIIIKLYSIRIHCSIFVGAPVRENSRTQLLLGLTDILLSKWTKHGRNNNLWFIICRLQMLSWIRHSPIFT